MTTKIQGKLNPDRLYLGDNGRAFCGALVCAGASSYYTGRDLSGQVVYMMTPEDVQAFARETGKVPRCEGCGKHGTRIAGVDGGACAVAP